MTQIPKTINEAIDVAVDMLQSAEKINPNSVIGDKNFNINVHHTFGQSLRNNWKLWNQESELHIEFLKRGIFHPDDMSSIIIQTAQYRLQGKENEEQFIDDLIKSFQSYWEDENETIN